MTTTELNEKKTKLDSLQKIVSRAEGAFEQTQKALKEEFGVSTVKEAEALLASLEKEYSMNEGDIQEFSDRLEKLTDWTKL